MKCTLPKDYAMKLIDKEIQLEGDCHLQVLTELVELYRVGIEYYEDIKDHRYWDFQNRLQKILLRPQVLQLMQVENQKYQDAHGNPRLRQRSQTHVPISSQEKVKLFEKNKKELTLKLEDTNAYQIANKTKTATKVVENQQGKTEEVISKAIDDIKSQEFNLNERLKQRKKRIIDCSLDSETNPSTTKDQSPGFTFPASPMCIQIDSSNNSSFFFEFGDEKSVNISLQKAEELEGIIEKIMEDNFMEKTDRVTEIKVKYETQINEYSGQGGIFANIINEMKMKMQEEIEYVTKELDLKRKDAIAKAKDEYSDFFNLSTGIN
ncbi:hypothetical protein SteCoe_570 [Stentor coeruleus]|uniref:Uncharacterized protein n=1 Tax=Stentor coeruleus TaxID=5963 RepID=A0A1R2D3Q2_9CILI|nr:hypothetical protein SteCoe_570 [Stentor coeruleus]